MTWNGAGLENSHQMNATPRRPLCLLETLFRERLREERIPLHLPSPPPPERDREPERSRDGGTCIIIKVWPTDPEPSGDDSELAR